MSPVVVRSVVEIIPFAEVGEDGVVDALNLSARK